MNLYKISISVDGINLKHSLRLISGQKYRDLIRLISKLVEMNALCALEKVI